MLANPVDLIFFFAAISISASYFFSGMLQLRVLAIIGAILYIIGELVAGLNTPGMFTMLIFTLLNFFINVCQ
ncbi:MAG: hypothetical protein ACHP6H_01395, partial [Legionellales bacterium]